MEGFVGAIEQSLLLKLWARASILQGRQISVGLHYYGSDQKNRLISCETTAI
ncbi:hypothetical protein yaldo0001_17310 [Yersinia aldovae ATCC 35236]|nr:hypothetical protein yaldo0001_17310 [Yersinia aldovae ATCC 35236]